MTELTEFLKALLSSSPEAASDELVEEVIDWLRNSDDPWSLLRPLLFNAVRGIRRERVRVAEHNAALALWKQERECQIEEANPPPLRRPVAEKIAFNVGAVLPLLYRRPDLLKHHFHVPGRGRVTWGEASETDHLARIAYLTKMKLGIDRTIDLHRQAVAEIQESGVRCLNEVKITEAV